MKRPLALFVSIGSLAAALGACWWGWQMKSQRDEAWRQQALAVERLRAMEKHK